MKPGGDNALSLPMPERAPFKGDRQVNSVAGACAMKFVIADMTGNKKGRGNIAPTFLISLSTPVPVHPWSKV
ncbi:hypothetical protein FY136_24435 [Agrobacterium tumefaciens]|uniref:hypothetical protein n=1 Tax=Agrobacterium tumefaciens TaxID=358 RepID=UPI0021D14DC1|nr:hypothetical protein [Agrobacterium tumefaciens]UXT52355.1 hypothetical protein FY136_24435 [Agrobacterium tumefaciens]